MNLIETADGEIRILVDPIRKELVEKALKRLGPTEYRLYWHQGLAFGQLVGDLKITGMYSHAVIFQIGYTVALAQCGQLFIE